MNTMVKLELDIRSAAAVRQVLFEEQSIYTYDPKCTPQRIVDIRAIIIDIDKQIEEELNDQTPDT